MEAKNNHLGYSFRLPIYGGIVYLCTDLEQIMELTSKYDLDDTIEKAYKESEGFCQTVWDKAKYFYVIGLNDNSALLHECVHLAHYIMDNVGVPINIDNTEVMAYLTEYLYNEMDSYLVNKEEKK